MFLRFVYALPVDGMDAREGFFQAASKLADDPLANPSVVAQVDELRNWFANNLELPERFNRTGSKGYYRKETRGLSWFKPSADQHIAKAFELKSILEDNGYPVKILKETRIGYVVYEDEHQVVAEPFSETLR